MKLLLTAFEPFGGDEVNASREAVRLVQPERCGVRIDKAVLPVTFSRSGGALFHAVGMADYNAVICVGQAGSRAELSMEKVAINLVDARIPDNDGAQPIDEPIVAGGPDAIFSTLPVRTMAEASRNAGVPAAISYSAGAYVCNFVMYLLLEHIVSSGLPVKAGFIHVPAVETMPPETAARGLEAAICAMARAMGE